MSTCSSPLVWPRSVPRADRRRFDGFQLDRWEVLRAATTRNIELLSRPGAAVGVVISSNLPLREDGSPLPGAPVPRDPGVAVYWTILFHGAPPKRGELACDGRGDALLGVLPGG